MLVQLGLSVFYPMYMGLKDLTGARQVSVDLSRLLTDNS